MKKHTKKNNNTENIAQSDPALTTTEPAEVTPERAEGGDPAPAPKAEPSAAPAGEHAPAPAKVTKPKRPRTRKPDKATLIAGLKTALISALALLSFLLISFFVVIFTDSMGDYHYLNLIFSLAWSAVFVGLLSLLPRLARRICYCAFYMLLLIYGFAQYVYYGFFGKLISFSSFANAGEGADYLSAVFEKIGPRQGTVFLLLIALGIGITYLIGLLPALRIRLRVTTVAAVLAAVFMIYVVFPLGFGFSRKSFTWTPADDLRYVYDNYLDKQACLGMAGYYQFLSLDIYNCFVKPLFEDTSAQRQTVEGFFADYKEPHRENDMTGILSGKNVVLVMMESMDYLALGDEKNTPTIHYMMENGINFTNYYAPLYGDGATFSNEFAMNTGILTPTNGKTLYNYQNNTYTYSMANLFEAAGYSADSYHENGGGFYNREDMHMAFGYDKYHSYYDYGGSAADVAIDTYLTRTPELLSDFLHEGEDKPFFNFLITYSAHLSYYYTESLAAYAYENYVQPGELLTGAEDLNCLRAKARITDRMLAELIEVCPEDTVFICATDHYCYGLSDETKSAELGEDENLRQRVPFFIYSKGEDIEPMTVDTYCANVDLLPTVANLVGLEMPEYTLGNDIFDPSFEGYVIFSDFAILNDQAYYKDGRVAEQFTETVDTEALQKLSEYAYKRAECSNYILSSDYYSHQD